MYIPSAQPYHFNNFQPDSSEKNRGVEAGVSPAEKEQEIRAEEENATKTSTQDKTQRLDEQDRRELQKLKQRDREVRAHEAAHMAVGASVTRGGMQFTYQRGPDGVMYAVGGEVSIDISKASTPEATLVKAETIRRAALAPAQPSSQDRSVAAKATQMAARARMDIAMQQRGEGEEEGQYSAGTVAIEHYHDDDEPYSSAMPSVSEYA